PSPLALHPFPTRRSSDLEPQPAALVDDRIRLRLLEQPALIGAVKIALAVDCRHSIAVDIDGAVTHRLAINLGKSSEDRHAGLRRDRKSTRLNSSHVKISY